MNSNDQKTYENEHEKIVDMRQVGNVESDVNVVEEVYFGNKCEQEVETNYYINDGTEKTKDYSFQNYVIEECNSFGNEKKNYEHYEEIKDYNVPKQEQETKSYENLPACSDNIPINLNSFINVNNCRPDSPTHCEVPKDEPCDLDVSIIEQIHCNFT